MCEAPMEVPFLVYARAIFHFGCRHCRHSLFLALGNRLLGGAATAGPEAGTRGSVFFVSSVPFFWTAFVVFLLQGPQSVWQERVEPAQAAHPEAPQAREFFR